MQGTIKGEINSSTVILRNFNILLTPVDTSFRQKFNKQTQDLNDTLEQLDLVDILGAFQPNNGFHHCFSRAPVTFFRLAHILDHNTSLGKFLKMEIILNIFLSIEYKIRYQLQTKKSYKNTNIWRLNNTYLKSTYH